MTKDIRILWGSPQQDVSLSFTNDGEILAWSFAPKEQSGSLSGRLTPGPNGTLVHVKGSSSFSFFLRDVHSQYPIYIPEYQVIVTTKQDSRSYSDIVDALCQRSTGSYYRQLECEPEMNFETAASTSRNMPCKTWLGIGRDVRLFELDYRTTTDLRDPWDSIVPFWHSTPVKLEALGNTPLRYNYAMGRGVGVRQDLTRRLEKGYLPILNTTLIDEGITYHSKALVTLEDEELTRQTVKGTDFRVTDLYSANFNLTPKQREIADKLQEEWLDYDSKQTTVLYMNIRMHNTDIVPRYGFIRVPEPNLFELPEMSQVRAGYDYEQGFLELNDSVLVVAQLDGKPAPSIENSVLLQPGESAEVLFMIPHTPIPRERAKALTSTSFAEIFQQSIAYWESHLADGAKIQLPEKRIEEMIRAGQLHLDMVCFGSEPDGPVTPVVGVYTPIGTESVPIVQFLDFMGKNHLAQRASSYFLEKQRDDGFMQNFQSYMSETGSALWIIGEHYHSTKDKKWLLDNKAKILKSCRFLENWIDENRSEELRGKGYGMISGKVADPEDPFHSYMLNGSVYAGLQSIGLALADINDDDAEHLLQLAKELRENILDSLDTSFALAPVVPLKDGSWAPAIPPWTEDIGALFLKVKEDSIYSHGTLMARDSILSPLYLIIHGVLAPESSMASLLMRVSSEIYFSQNTAFSQPYYSVHPYVHLSVGQVAPFLMEFYSNVAALADRETYTFWEHLYQVSVHKTHEEAWFLMRCKWMLCMDEEDLHLLAGVPRAWLQNSEEIIVEDVQTRHGKLSYHVLSHVSEGRVDVSVSLEAHDNMPTLRVRIPHPEKLSACRTTMGHYDNASETVTLENFTGEAVFSVYF